MSSSRSCQRQRLLLDFLNLESWPIEHIFERSGYDVLFGHLEPLLEPMDLPVMTRSRRGLRDGDGRRR